MTGDKLALRTRQVKALLAQTRALEEELGMIGRQLKTLRKTKRTSFISCGTDCHQEVTWRNQCNLFKFLRYQVE